MGIFPGVMMAMLSSTMVFVGGIGYEAHTSQGVPSHIKHMTTVNPTSAVVLKPELLKFLPKGTQLIPSNSDGSVIQQVDLDNDGEYEYTALYKYPHDDMHFVGAIVFVNDHGTIKKIWQYNGKISLVSPSSLTIKDLQNDGNKEIIFKAHAGAMANYYDILAPENGGVKSVFHTFAYRMDLGHYGRTKSNQIITWTLDTGFLYHIEVYGWNPKAKQFERTANNAAPEYFKDTVIPYYKNVAKSSQGKQVPKMIDYGLAQAYFYAGEYQAALAEVNSGLKFSANDYPPNSDFLTLKHQTMKAIAATPSPILGKPVVNTEKSNHVQIPSLIKNAMKRFPSNILTMAKVPTFIPESNSPSPPLTYRTWDFTSGPILSYNVLLSDSGNQVATFIGTKYQSNTFASGAVQLPENLTTEGKLSSFTVDLNHRLHVQAKVFHLFGASANENAFGELIWNDQKWGIEVTNNQSTQLPIQEANSLIKDLQTIVLPHPINKGTVFIDIEPGNQVSMYIKWQEGSRVYEVDTYSDCKNPIQSGLKMAKSMTDYLTK